MKNYMVFVFFLGLCVNFLLLFGASSICDQPAPTLRILAASIVGGAYGSLCLLQSFQFLGGLFWRSVILWLMSLVAFGFCLSTLRSGTVFFLLSMALSGVVAVLGSTDFFAVLCASGVVVSLCAIGLYRHFHPQLFVPVELTYGNITRTVTALRDTGNMLKDPVTGESVLVISAELAEFFTGLTRLQLKDPIGSMGAIPGLRLIPYRAVGNSGGMLLALRFPVVKIGARKGSALVALSAENLHNNGKYQALTGG